MQLNDYLDYYNNHRIKAKLKGLPQIFTDNKPFNLPPARA
ncbi:MAG: IS3 family transposase [Oscillospiraceae bacterium]